MIGRMKLGPKELLANRKPPKIGSIMTRKDPPTPETPLKRHDGGMFEKAKAHMASDGFAQKKAALTGRSSLLKKLGS